MLKSNSNPILPSGPVVFKWDYSSLTDEDRQAVRSYVIQIKDLSRKVVQHAITIGGALNQVKRRLDHGDFTDWCETEFQMSQQSAERLMNLATQAFQNPQIVDSGFGLSVLYQLTAPSVTPEVQQAVVHELEIYRDNGEKITNPLAAASIKAAKTKYEQLERAYLMASPAVREIVEKWEVTDQRTVFKLRELEKSNDRRGSNHTFEDIQRTGVIQPGDEKEAVRISAEWPFIERALKLIGQHHARENSKRELLFQGRYYIEGNAVIFYDELPSDLPAFGFGRLYEEPENENQS